MTLAGRRAEAAEKPGTGPETGESNWYVMQGFGNDQAGLAARHALKALLSLYGDRLGGCATGRQFDDSREGRSAKAESLSIT